MSLAENLLETIEDVEEAEDFVEEEPHIIVNESRQIIVPDKLKTIAVTEDKNIETVTIDCVRYWDDHDLSTFAIYLSCTLPNGDEITITPYPITIYDNYFSFNWTIDNYFTQHEGSFKISVIALKTDDEGNELNRWGSIPNSDLTVVKGLKISKFPSTPQNRDILSQTVQRLNELEINTNIYESILQSIFVEVMPIDGEPVVDEER